MPKINTKSFFRTDLIGKYLDKKTYKVMNRFGAVVRLTAQRSMRYKKGASPKGTPPHAHNKDGKKALLRKLLFYQLGPNNKSVVVGPVLKDSTRRLVITRLHEEGGRSTTVIRQDGKKKRVPAVYPARPTMKPAFSKNVGKVTQMYKNIKV